MANEGTVQKSLPFGHSIIEDIFANPVPAERLVTNDVRGLYGNQEANQEAPASESAGVLRDVRTPAEPGGVQVQDEGGAGGTGGPSLVEEQASEGVGGAPEPDAGDSAGQVLPVEIESVKRAEDFSLNGTMNVTMADGDVYQMSRDPVARGWVLNPQHHDEFDLGFYHPYRIGTFANNKKEAEQILTELHNEKLARNAPTVEAEPAPRQELRDTLIQSIPEDGISAAQLSEQVGQEEGNFRDLLDQMEEDGDILSELTPDGERYFPNPDSSRFIRVPRADEDAPILPMGKIEESLQQLLRETDGNPTSEQLATITGSPKPRKGKEELDKNVRPRTLEELRGFMREAQKESQGLAWYDQFGRFFQDLVGDANLDEASIIFGVTSQQNSAEQNLADTLHIMAVARRTDPLNKKQFELALRNTRRPNGQKLKITGDQIKSISEMYELGRKSGGIKVTTYMQMVQDRGRNIFNPFSVQDVHMSRVFGFNRRDVDKKSGEVVDEAKFSGENDYRYAQYLTSVLADEFNVTPNQAQALLWFYAKQNLSPAKAWQAGYI